VRDGALVETHPLHEARTGSKETPVETTHSPDVRKRNNQMSVRALKWLRRVFAHVDLFEGRKVESAA